MKERVWCVVLYVFDSGIAQVRENEKARKQQLQGRSGCKGHVVQRDKATKRVHDGKGIQDGQMRTVDNGRQRTVGECGRRISTGDRDGSRGWTRR